MGTGTRTSGRALAGNPMISTGRTEKDRKNALAQTPPPLSSHVPVTLICQLPKGPSPNTAVFSVTMLSLSTSAFSCCITSPTPKPGMASAICSTCCITFRCTTCELDVYSRRHWPRRSGCALEGTFEIEVMGSSSPVMSVLSGVSRGVTSSSSVSSLSMSWRMGSPPGTMDAVGPRPRTTHQSLSFSAARCATVSLVAERASRRRPASMSMSSACSSAFSAASRVSTPREVVLLGGGGNASSSPNGTTVATAVESS
mmetsp:Transcript_7015/g.17991  ORF Transcript_7015/g.17991 Transcript_7015/m.17991 type:complete len:256 (+) Transcript_7015:454-1221(+)